MNDIKKARWTKRGDRFCVVVTTDQNPVEGDTVVVRSVKGREISGTLGPCIESTQVFEFIRNEDYVSDPVNNFDREVISEQRDDRYSYERIEKK